MAGLVPASTPFPGPALEGVDARHKAGHDALRRSSWFRKLHFKSDSRDEPQAPTRPILRTCARRNQDDLRLGGRWLRIFARMPGLNCTTSSALYEPVGRNGGWVWVSLFEPNICVDAMA
jgi:hypothetical protein